jgi:hypothetical protein
MAAQDKVTTDQTPRATGARGRARPAQAGSPPPPAGSGAATASQAVETDGIHWRLPLLGQVTLPPTQHLVWYAGIAALAVVEIVDWPVAIAMGVGKALSDNRHSRTLRQLGQAIEEGS